LTNMDITDVDPHKRSWVWQVNWLLLMLGPIAAALAIVVNNYDAEGFQHLQVLLEYPAPWMVASVVVIYAIRSVATRNPLYVLSAVLAVIFTLREFHFEWVHHGVYAMLAGLAIWTVIWRKKLVRPLKDYQHTSWLIATATAYLLSQLIARRAFRPIPGEDQIHRSLEECAETAAHLMFIATSLVGNWRKAASASSQDSSAAG